MESDPVEVLDQFLGLIKEAFPKQTKDQLRTKQSKELDMWHTWNNGGRKPEYLQPLYHSVKPFIEQKAKELGKNRTIVPPSAIDAEMRYHFVEAAKSFNPEKGQFSTWLGTRLKRTGRYIRNYQNLGHMSERNIGAIREFTQARSELTEKHGYEPDVHALADHLGWAPRRTMQLHRELTRRDLAASVSQFDVLSEAHPQAFEAIHLLQYDTRLTPQDRTVYEYTFGMNGKPALKPGQIAQRTGLHPSKVSRIRKKLQGLTTEVMGSLES